MKVMTAAQAIAQFVPENATLAVGGMHMHNNPMALVRELVRQGRRVGRLVTSPSACINADLLLSAGLVAEILTSYVGFEHLGLPPGFRRAVEGGAVRLLEADEFYISQGLYAGAGGLPFIPYPPGMERTDIPGVNPDCYQQTTDPFTQKPVTVLKPIKPQVAFIHCQEADERGNAVFRGAQFTDRIMALAADRVIIQAERIVANDRIRSYNSGALVPGFIVAAVVAAPGGCWPTASHGEYHFDEQGLLAYLGAAKTPEGAREYVQKAVLPPEDQVVPAERLQALREGVGQA